MNYKPMFIFAGGERQGNAQVFATEAEALESAKARFNSWTMPVGYTVDETLDTVNYKYSNGDVRL